ncbi:NAD(P)-dependent dehydrogenase (short-subunit alcohol dehydrogenase family) [Sphingomonas jinjuensis]|uniref:NAD(P)-dependent dehydrogenase (Short-subunit alcohol dehydrogenase family) n=1 Tax=Sphingomonas jinjuensis TaxID=535907 RepID=A0A840F829_9SPHN|nr:SDR family NAD(P)-dependent oxidoreductase [Sphingomonas jinjuensis]MBB4154120.1 NAD(P)-dependent dehydrogenase (short-subunit alcohol dehydrogenase family) [Sphingomonas jinjuensis]
MDRIIVITGAGAGLGRALAREAVGRGDTVIALGRSERGLLETGAGLPPSLYQSEIVDVADFTAVEATLARALENYGRVDALIANAAVYPRVSLIEQSAADWMQVFTVNVGGVVACIRGVLPAMMAVARGRITVVGSFADGAPIANSSAYSASKGALHSLVKAIEAELAGDFPDILVNEWVPGGLRTDMGTPDGLDPATAARWGIDLIDLPAGGPSGRIFDRDQLVEPPRSFKRRLLRKLLRR